MRTPRSLILAMVLGFSSLAHADFLDRSVHQRPLVLSFFTGVPYYYGIGPVGVGARFYIPILHDGFIRPINDEFGIEFGGDFTWYGILGGPGGLGVSIPVEVLWDFHFTRRFDAYAKVGAAFTLGFPNAGSALQPFSFYPVTAVGLRFHLTSWFYLRAEAGYPWLKVGIGFAF